MTSANDIIEFAPLPEAAPAAPSIAATLPRVCFAKRAICASAAPAGLDLSIDFFVLFCKTHSDSLMTDQGRDFQLSGL